MTNIDVEKIKQSFVDRKQAMLSEQKAMLFSIRKHYEENPDICFQKMSTDIKTQANDYKKSMDILANTIADCADKSMWPYAVRSSKHNELVNSINNLLEYNGADTISKFILNNNMPEYKWHDADSSEFPVLKGEHGNRYWGTPNVTYLSGLLYLTCKAIKLDFDLEKPASIYYHYNLPHTYKLNTALTNRIKVIHSGFVFGGAGENLFDYNTNNPFPPHDCSSFITSIIPNCPFRISTIDQYVAYNYNYRLKLIADMLPKDFLGQIDKLRFFNNQLSKALTLRGFLQPVDTHKIEPGDIYISRTLNTKSTYSSYFFGTAGHTSVIYEKIRESNKVKTLDFNRDIENNIEGFGYSYKNIVNEYKNEIQITKGALRYCQ